MRSNSRDCARSQTSTGLMMPRRVLAAAAMLALASSNAFAQPRHADPDPPVPVGAHMAGELRADRGRRMRSVPTKARDPRSPTRWALRSRWCSRTSRCRCRSRNRAGCAGLAVTAPKRLAVASDIPTVAESGLPDSKRPRGVGLFAPAAVPRDIVAKLQTEAAAALNIRGQRENGHTGTVRGRQHAEQFGGF